jgi:molybdopterin-binding protein
LSGRNRLRGFVEEVRTDGLLGQIRLRIGDQTLTAVITADAIRRIEASPRRRCGGDHQVDRSDDFAREVEDTPAPARRRRPRR